MRLLTALGVLAWVVGCSSGPAQGTERGSCYANGTCNAGLTCLSNVCVSTTGGDSGTGGPDAGADAGTSGNNDAGTATDAGTDAGVSGTDAGTDAGCPATFAGKLTTTFGSLWSYQAQVGLAAGNQACVDTGADHVCDYDDLVYAASKGELSTLSTSDTVWLQRGHPVTVSGSSPKIVVLGQATTSGTYKVSQAGSNCAGWNYATDHLNDGEWVDFSTGTSTPTFHLDDNPCAIQTLPKDIPCGHNTMQRSVLCCFRKSVCNPAVTPATCTCSGGTCS